jgi:hypothetical protein
MRYTYEQLRALTKDEVIAHYDALSRNAEPGLNFYRDELVWRQQDAQTAEMLALTRSVRRLTFVITALTVVITLLTAASVALVIRA